ncbi:inner-membrane translocator [Thermoproteus uzoniensis 768-20]|uniref:Inner-membrane translocator n=1 Tax=Thermoproteus uzoniensis (strain 768-20) TaxID=999630 RepID=F2L0J8_THEU7|nr:branched-chain amino acid ABC transporter permease [Thermoproteus uzoniensis]AEA12680.1 inner-membrane translocator [Thermoproteus uzoniensis 768-20]
MIALILPVLIFWIDLVLLSMGLAIVYGSSKILNLAHGSFFVLGGYLASYLASDLGLVGIPLAALAALPLSALFYLYIKAFARSELEQIVATYALLLIMEGVFEYVFGVGLYTSATQAAGLGMLEIAGAQLPTAYLIGAAAAAAALGGFAYVLYRTNFGAYARAVIDDREMAESLGVNTRRAEILLVLIGVLFAVLGGALASMWRSYGLGLAAEVLPYAFAVIVIGGLENIWGVAAASAIVSAVRTVVVYVYPRLELVVLYIVVLAVLAIRPQGLFARHVRSI